MQFVILFVEIFARSLVFLLFLHVLLSLFMPADKPLRIGVARLVDPILYPIKRFIKPMNGIDFSPVVAILVVNLIEWLLIRLLSRLV
ncbi:MAG: YggT family protein [Arcobacter sp.]|jgi:YggT family protein|uniref:YggT family protein n=1 Tax=Arcobacter sp. TaxID=1872629 RepID=UPI002A751142|nr:YggT family protein [Arcobacter sp.]MDY3205729.1 YggT family protein [Arcobacter sp.]